MGVKEEYDRIFTGSRVYPKRPKPYFPTPTVDDYSRGFMYRYFAKMLSNQKSIPIEISEKDFNYYNNLSRVTTTSLYEVTKIRWKITGEPTDVQLMNAKSTGVREQNMRGISLILTNPLQFYKR